MTQNESGFGLAYLNLFKEEVVFRLTCLTRLVKQVDLPTHLVKQVPPPTYLFKQVDPPTCLVKQANL